MSEEKFLSIEETFTKKLKHAWDNGFENGKSSALPWRKPEERPENRKDVICILKNLGDLFSGTCYWGDQEWKFTIESEISEYKMRPENLVAWLYTDELPLPDWVRK